MTRALAVHRHFLVFITIVAMAAATLLVTAGPILAAPEDQCTGESSVVDFGTFYLVKGTWGDDTIDCSAADKPVVVEGGFGDDWIWGSDFADTLKGGFGDDWLFGLDGNDWLLGGWGDDYMSGGDDTDTCLGGRGIDGFGDGGCETEDYGLEP